MKASSADVDGGADGDAASARTRVADADGGAQPKHCVHVVLYDADGSDREVGVEQIDVGQLQDQQLLWVDVSCNDTGLIDDIGARLGLPPGAIAALGRMDSTPGVENYGDCFHVQAVAVHHEGALRFTGRVLGLVAGANFVLSVHHQPVPFIAHLRERERGESELGALSAESFTASLLDWQLSTYFDAVSDFEAAVERLEVEILSEKSSHCLEELRHLRRGASRLRRMLAPHRALFAGLARPDFRPRSTGEVNVHFERLGTHYERALDMVQNTRDLVVGSFELFSSQTALRTNAAMRMLTFVTVLLGTLAVLAGVLGMNFDAPLFHTGGKGFAWTLAGMGALVVIAVVLVRRRRWL